MLLRPVLPCRSGVACVKANTRKVFLRLIYVAKTKSRKSTTDHQKYIDKVEFQQDQVYRRKLKELHDMTKLVAQMIRKKERHLNVEDRSQIPRSSDIHKQVDKVYNSLSPKNQPFDASNHTLVTPIIDIPQSIQDKLGLAINFLVSKSDQNWPLILDNLQLSGGFSDITEKDIRKFIYNIPKQFLGPVVPQLEALLKQVNVTPSSKILNEFIKGLSIGRDVLPANLEVIEKYVDDIKAANKNKLPRDTCEILIKVYGKNNDLDKINSIVEEMKRRNLKIGSEVYTNILQTMVYKAKNHKDAVSLFDTMNFLSVDMKPKTDAYHHVIVSYVNNKEIEKALDLYQEMLQSRIPINQEILVALSRGCISRKHLKAKAWDFMFEIYENNWTPTLETLEYILYLASEDGDLPLARALYKHLSSINATNKRNFTFLLIGYYKTNHQGILNLFSHPKGATFRANLIFKSHGLPTNVPFLPVVELNTPEQIMAESKAIWTYNLMHHPEYIHINAYSSYLNIAAELGSFKHFMDRYKLSKLIDDGSINDTRVIVEDDAPSNAVPQLLRSQNHPVINRSTIIYKIALKAAGRFKDYKFAQKVWEERGKYRKSSEFKALDPKRKTQLDFEFANEMVQALTKMNLLDDALAIVISTEYQFKWSWNELNSVYRACQDIGHEIHCITLRNIAKRAQIRFEGKITRRQYREFMWTNSK